MSRILPIALLASLLALNVQGEGADGVLQKISAQEARLPKVGKLISDARESGLAVDYPTADFLIATRFCVYGRDDVANDRLARAQEVVEEVTALLDRAEREARAGVVVPRLLPGTMRIEEGAFWARCQLGELETRLAEVDTTQGRARDECVRVTTIHRVKGLEWDYVFIPECDEGWMPLPGDEESGCFAKRDADATLERSPAVESERRLFYVGITRARTACFVSCGDEEARSRFLRDALQPAAAKPRR